VALSIEDRDAILSVLVECPNGLLELRATLIQEAACGTLKVCEARRLSGGSGPSLTRAASRLGSAASTLERRLQLAFVHL
jgi:hypothetical protein